MSSEVAADETAPLTAVVAVDSSARADNSRELEENELGGAGSEANEDGTEKADVASSERKSTIAEATAVVASALIMMKFFLRLPDDCSDATVDTTTNEGS